MPSRLDYDQTLDKLAAMLRRKPMTAKAIAAHFKCCRPVAYQRLRDLKARGETLTRKKVRESATGPKSYVYSVAH